MGEKLKHFLSFFRKWTWNTDNTSQIWTWNYCYQDYTISSKDIWGKIWWTYRKPSWFDWSTVLTEIAFYMDIIHMSSCSASEFVIDIVFNSHVSKKREIQELQRTASLHLGRRVKNGKHGNACQPFLPMKNAHLYARRMVR